MSYKENLDLHELTARNIFNIPNDQEVSKYQRNIGKVINFLDNFMENTWWIIARFKNSFKRSHNRVVNKYFDQYPVKEFWKYRRIARKKIFM